MTTERGPSYPETIDEIKYRVTTGHYKSRAMVYKGITFRSRLEVRFAIHLDAMDERWSYEPRAFGGYGEGYLPDFEIRELGQPTYVEVKPTAAEIPEAQRRMEVIWQTVPDALLIVACEEGCTFHAALGRGPWEMWAELWG